MNSRRRALLALGLGGLALTGAGALPGGSVAAPAWVAACVFWGGLSLGSLVLLMIHHLTGGDWGEVLQRPLLAAAGTLPLLALFLLPLLAVPHGWYPWAAADGPAREVPAWYLNVPFFRVRAVLYLLLWLALALALGAWRGRRAAGAGRAAGLSAGGLVALVATTSLAAFDWVMSLDPQWYSALFGLLVGTGQVVAALALAVLWRLLARTDGRPGPQQRHDLGNLLLALVLLWSYLAFMQFITIWIADLPREIRWYLPRLQTDWRWLGIAILTLHLLLPLPLLLARAVKRARLLLALVAALLLCAQGLYALWLTLPTLRPAGPGLAATDLAVFAGPGGLWLAAFLWRFAPAAAPPGRVPAAEAG